MIAFARYLPVTPALQVTSETCPLPLDYSTKNDAHCVRNEKQKKYDVGHCQSSEAPVRSHSGVTQISELISGVRAETEESHSHK